MREFLRPLLLLVFLKYLGIIKNYYNLIHVIFKQPRKTLYNNLRDGLELPAENIKIDYVTVFVGDNNVPRDEESAKIWQGLGFSEEKGNLKFYDKKENFWGPTGEEGPCGPTTEIYVDGVEVWNLVFNQCYQQKDKTLKIRLNENGKKLVNKKTPEEELFIQIPNHNNYYKTDLTFDQLNDEQKTAFENLRSRGLVTLNIHKERIIMLTDLGKELIKQKIDLNVIESLTHEVIKNKEWKKKKLILFLNENSAGNLEEIS